MFFKNIKLYFPRREGQRMQGDLEGCSGQSLHHDLGGEAHGLEPDGLPDHLQG
jgi:hypothetical protein